MYIGAYLRVKLEKVYYTKTIYFCKNSCLSFYCAEDNYCSVCGSKIYSEENSENYDFNYDWLGDSNFGEKLHSLYLNDKTDETYFTSYNTYDGTENFSNTKGDITEYINNMFKDKQIYIDSLNQYFKQIIELLKKNNMDYSVEFGIIN